MEDHDYQAAESYLGLIHSENSVRDLVSRLKAAPVTRFKAKDIFRASQLSLLVRDESTRRVVIADGYHRLCAIYRFDEDAWIHCKIV